MKRVLQMFNCFRELLLVEFDSSSCVAFSDKTIERGTFRAERVVADGATFRHGRRVIWINTCGGSRSREWPVQTA